MDNINGYGLFNDVKEKHLQARNRAMALANISEDNLNEAGELSRHGMSLVISYYDKIPKEEREDVYHIYHHELILRGLMENNL